MRYVYRFECINVYLFIFVHTQHQVWVREQGVREEEQRLQRDRERLHAVVRDAELRHQRRHKAAEEARQTHLYIHKCVCIYKYIQHIYFSCVRGCRAVSVLMYVSVFMHVCGIQGGGGGTSGGRFCPRARARAPQRSRRGHTGVAGGGGGGGGGGGRGVCSAEGHACGGAPTGPRRGAGMTRLECLL